MACMASAIATFCLCWWAKSICIQFGLMDVPDERKQHRAITPLIGGLAMMFVALPICALIVAFGTPPQWQFRLTLLAVAVIAMTLTGIADDRHSLAARDRLLFSFLVFATLAVAEPVFNVRVLNFDFPKFELGMATKAISIIFTTVCCVGLINAINMADGKNGLVIGLSIGWLAMLAYRCPAPLLPLVFVLLAVLSVLLVFNLQGRIFLGDGGAYGLGCMIGLLTIASYNSRGADAARSIFSEDILLIFAVPVLDSFRLTYSRIRRRQSPMTADRSHFHHYLQNWLGWPGGLIVYLGIALIPAAIGLLQIMPTAYMLAVVVITYAVVVAISVSRVGRQSRVA